MALLPHGPGLHDVLRAAEALNRPLRVVAGGRAEQAGAPLLSVDHPGVDVDAVSGPMTARATSWSGSTRPSVTGRPWRWRRTYR